MISFLPRITCIKPSPPPLDHDNIQNNTFTRTTLNPPLSSPRLAHFLLQYHTMPSNTLYHFSSTSFCHFPAIPSLVSLRVQAIDSPKATQQTPTRSPPLQNFNELRFFESTGSRQQLRFESSHKGAPKAGGGQFGTFRGAM